MSSEAESGPPNEDQGPVILGATLTVTIAALITTITRLYVRTVMIRSPGRDDYVMISAMILCIVGQILVVPEVYYGAGRHIQYIEPQHFATGYKLNFITQPIYLFAIALVKISVGFFLLRIAVRPFYRRVVIGIMAFMALYTIGCFFTVMLQCTNLAVQWDHTVKATCWSAYTIKTLSYVNVSLNILTDLLFSIVIPIPLLWSVQMNNNSRKTTAPQFGYSSRPYGVGTRQSGAMGWGTLTSNKIADETDGPRACKRPGDSYMLTTINAERDRKTKSAAMSASDEEGEILGNSSTESLRRGHSGRLGGIKVNTEVNVVESHSPLDFGFEESDRHEKKDMV